MDYRLVAAVDIEHLNPAECTHQYYLAQMALEEENARHAAKVRELDQFMWELKPRVPAHNLLPQNAAMIRANLELGNAPDAAARLEKRE
jgi:hypothetical protein